MELEQRIERFLGGAPHAVVGASRDRSKYGNKVLRAYLQRGRPVYAVNPVAGDVEGQPAYPDLQALPEKPHGISIITPPEVTEAIVEDAIALGIENIWMQPGAESDRAVRRAEAAGCNVIAGGPCVLVVLGLGPGRMPGPRLPRGTDAEQQKNQLPPIEGHDGILTLRSHGNCRDWNGIHYRAGLSGRNVGAAALSMNVATIPPGGVAYAHIHEGFEVMLFIVQGRVRHDYGPDLRHRIENGAGDFIYIAPGVPHEVYNLSDTDPVVAVVARSAADEWDRIRSYPRPGGPDRG